MLTTTHGTIWTPADDRDPIQKIARMLRQFTEKNVRCVESAKRIAMAAIDANMTPTDLDNPITYDVAQGPIGERMCVVVHLDHDYYGPGVIRVFTESEYDIRFQRELAPAPCQVNREALVIAMIATWGGVRSALLDAVRDGVRDTHETSDLPAINAALNGLLAEYRHAVDGPAALLDAYLLEQGAYFKALDTKALEQMARAEASGIILVTASGQEKKKPRVLEQEGRPFTDPSQHGVRAFFASDVDGSPDQFYHPTDLSVTAQINKALAALIKREKEATAYLYRALSDLTRVGFTVRTRRTQGGDHLTEVQEGGVVSCPLLWHATEMECLIPSETTEAMRGEINETTRLIDEYRVAHPDSRIRCIAMEVLWNLRLSDQSIDHAIAACRNNNPLDRQNGYPTKHVAVVLGTLQALIKIPSPQRVYRPATASSGGAA